jgi:hypothetical protein
MAKITELKGIKSKEVKGQNAGHSKKAINIKSGMPELAEKLFIEICYGRMTSSESCFACPVCRGANASAKNPLCGICVAVYGSEMANNIEDLVRRFIAFRSVMIRSAVFEVLISDLIEGDISVNSLRNAVKICLDDFDRLPESFVDSLINEGLENYHFYQAKEIVNAEIPRLPFFFNPDKKAGEFHALHPEIPLNLLKDACMDLLEDRNATVQESVDIELGICPFHENNQSSETAS